MEMSNLLDILIFVIIAGGGWYINQINNRINRLEDRLNSTRETFIHKDEISAMMGRMEDRFARLEDLLHRLMEK
jgi:uncharacterized coiled-coil protein SlyX